MNMSRFPITCTLNDGTILSRIKVKEISIICDLCHCLLYDSCIVGIDGLCFYDVPINEQLDKPFISVTEGNESIQYCQSCAQIIQVAPL